MNTADIPDRVNEELQSLTDRIARAISRGKFTAAELQAAIGQRSKQVASKTDELVHAYAWTAVGVGVGLGVLIGLLTGRVTRAGHAERAEEEAVEEEHSEERYEPSRSSKTWDTVQTLLPLAVLALKAFQDLRAARNGSRH